MACFHPHGERRGACPLTGVQSPTKEDGRSTLHLIIIGAGLCGLSAAISTRLEGHAVTLLESARELAEIGAGLGLTPNATRLFRRWGVYDQLAKVAAPPRSLSLRRYDGTVLVHEGQFQEKLVERYGAPFWGMHRVDLQRILANRAQELGVVVRLSARVVGIDFDRPSVTLESGEIVTGDAVLGADGLWSTSRDLFLGRHAPAKLTGDIAYRIVLHRNEIIDPELREWVARPRAQFWAGPHSHAAGYSVRGGEMFNLVLLCPDDLVGDVRRAEGNTEEMRGRFEGWDPILKGFLAQVKKVDKWRLLHLEPLPAWKNPQGTFVMAGDACHPMLPYLAQGANSSLEDGAVLGFLLGKASSKAQVKDALGMYERVRKARGEEIGRETFKQRDSLHLPDGPAQEARDVILLSQLGAAEIMPDFPCRWLCPKVQAWLFGYDAYKEAREAWEKNPF
ncbi:MAG: hypothetical protein M1839_008918 [Geoglossum umbratile]|nr:MAG: hypothetical protein M1839_008918 [Geoglossum umbratile]